MLDFSAQAAENPDFLLEVEHIREWESTHGPLPEGGWLLFRTGWDARSSSQQDFLNADDAGPHTPGISPACARWLGEEAPVVGLGVETVGTDAGAAHSFDPPFPCHSALMGSGKYGLTQLQNLAQLPPTGALLIAGPLPIVARLRCAVAGAGPGRARMTVADVVGRTLVRGGIDAAFGVVGSGNFAVTNAMVAAGARFVAARHEGGAATMADAYARMSGRPAAVTVHQGCGLTNALTGITEAAKSRTPLVVVAAEATQPRSNFYVDQAALAAAVGAVPMRVDVRPGGRRERAATAVATAVRDRRVVLLNLPLDVQAQEASRRPGTRAAGVDGRRGRPGRRRRADPGDRRPRAGRCSSPVAVPRGARAALESLAERCGALLATSAVAKGLFAGNPWSLDVSGGFASPLAAELISGADLIVGWGCQLNMWTMRHGRLIADDAVVVQVDVDRRRARRPAARRLSGWSATCDAVAGAVRCAAAPPATGPRRWRRRSASGCAGGTCRSTPLGGPAGSTRGA